MLPKKNRADKKTVNTIFKEGKFINSPNFSFKFIPAKGQKISFIAPKSVSKLAVKRNKLKRLGYSILQKLPKNVIPAVYGVFIFKKHQDDVSILEHDIKEIFSKVH